MGRGICSWAVAPCWRCGRKDKALSGDKTSCHRYGVVRRCFLYWDIEYAHANAFAHIHAVADVYIDATTGLDCHPDAVAYVYIDATTDCHPDAVAYVHVDATTDCHPDAYVYVDAATDCDAVANIYLDATSRFDCDPNAFARLIGDQRSGER